MKVKVFSISDSDFKNHIYAFFLFKIGTDDFLYWVPMLSPAARQPAFPLTQKKRLKFKKQRRYFLFFPFSAFILSSKTSAVS